MFSNWEVLSPPLVPYLQSSTSGIKNIRAVWCMSLCTFCDRGYSLHSKFTNAICKGETCQVNNTAPADLNAKEDMNCTFLRVKVFTTRNTVKILFFLLHTIFINEQDSRSGMLVFDIQVLSYASVITEILKGKLSFDSLICKGLICRDLICRWSPTHTWCNSIIHSTACMSSTLFNDPC